MKKSLSQQIPVRIWSSQTHWIVRDENRKEIKTFNRSKKSKVEVENWATKNGYRVVSQ